MVGQRTLQRLHNLIWALIYGGLFLAVTGYVTMHDSPTLGWTLLVVGVLAVIAGGVLIWVRSRLRPEPG